ncbi:MAG TPA: OB-fold nucleic acid binding domain-containing protein [Tetrasphaera sp.]|uniref:OB-fold nucleic acid binding domain-containing protein n=1 Tax=Nostocoides sp. TaxID=1917966 RepID=UPI002CE785A5|nr:OB-fold nucleic acid binding domain-containing protein [Tetrasphaera sp.]HNQ07089.1 OB-fold nucleic acid binding domain-containing protein [Tetrasphaera sp.]
MSGTFRRLTERLTRTAGDRDAAELQEHARSTGATVIGELADRQLATVTGIVRAVTLRPRTRVPALVVELYDGTQSLTLVWLGRRRISGIEPGARLRATGRVCHPDGVATIFNAAYELLPRAAGGTA